MCSGPQRSKIYYYYLPAEEAATKEKQAKLNGDELGEVMWSFRPLIASGFGVADGAREVSGMMDFFVSF